MNPLTKVKLINELNEREADLGIKDSVSWHVQYRDSAWIFIGGFPFDLTEGDIICVFSQYGEIANINLVRDKKTGKSKGFCFLCYEDQRSTILAVDNFNGMKIKGRTLRVDHVANYRPPKDSDDIDDITKKLREEGCAPKVPSSPASLEDSLLPAKKPKKDKKEKKKKKKEKKEKRKATEAESPSTSPVRVKKEKEDTGYEKYTLKGAPESRGQEMRNQQDRPEEPDRSRSQHGSERRDREEERRTDRSKDNSDRERGREGVELKLKEQAKAKPEETSREGQRYYTGVNWVRWPRPSGYYEA
ncbi:RNA-binding motif protein, X-linked 2 isoform X2 [Trichomycterus rosablanca]|uniref:RNA-binding motif protein, X-linked 2 isoform X2 n=1 Tax=Trichomycterus rosablanca TaxID=2290929 RepID=UPI002F3563E4